MSALARRATPYRREVLLKCIPLVVLVAAAVLAVAPSATAAPVSAADLDCSDFATQAGAQSYFLALGGPSSDPDRLDADGDGIACESNPCPCNYSTTPTTPTPAPPADADSDGVPDTADACPTKPAPTSNGCPPPPPPPPPDPPARTSFYAVVTAVVDGDTIRVRRGPYRTHTVRLIGIDTPETKRPGTPVECGGPNATSNMFRLGFTRPRDTTATGLRPQGRQGPPRQGHHRPDPGPS